MNPHLHFKIRWDNLKKYLTPYNNTAITPPTKKKKKNHILKNKINIQIKNRKYINQKMVCSNKNCKTIGKITIQKKKKEFPLIKQPKKKIDTLEKEKNFKIFANSFIEHLHDFKNSLSKKVFEIKKVPENNFTKEYIDEKINIFLGNDIKLEQNQNWSLKYIFNINDINVHEWFGNNVEIWALSISKDFNDIRTIIELDKKNKISLVNLFNNKVFMMGSPFIYLIESLKHFYFSMNTIIYCGYYNKPDKWGVMNDNHIWKHILAEDNFTFIPKWRYQYLNPYNEKTIYGIEYIKNKNNINELLKDIFRFIYTWQFLKEYTENKYNIKICSFDNFNKYINYDILFN